MHDYFSYQYSTARSRLLPVAQAQPQQSDDFPIIIFLLTTVQ